MCAIRVCFLLWKVMFCNLILFGKIIMFPFFAIATITLLSLGAVELLLVDVWVILLVLLSKDLGLYDLWEWLSW